MFNPRKMQENRLHDGHDGGKHGGKRGGELA